MYYHAIAVLPGDRRKSIVNKSYDEMLAQFVVPFVSTGAVRAKWGAKTQSYQVLELRVYQTEKAWDKKTGIPLEAFLGKKKNQFPKFEQRAKQDLGIGAHRVFVIMPIQGEKFGTQDEQRIFKEYDERFEVIENALSAHDCLSIRIDKEHPIEDLVARIKAEIKRAEFIVADLTDERPSCYYEAGYAEALNKPVIYIASKESVIHPGNPTKIHFDVHMSVNFFVNHTELSEKLNAAVEKNKDRLFSAQTLSQPLSVPDEVPAPA
jgi:hypothetical protein